MSTPTPKHQFLDAYDREHGTTMRVLNAYPREKLDLRPAAKLRTARELAWIFVQEQALCEIALSTGFDWTKPMPSHQPPESLDEIMKAFDLGHNRVVERLLTHQDSNLMGTVQFPVGPKKMGDVPLQSFLWMTLHDQIHHRGQFSIYLRIADAKVPSIYGPTHDEPWM